MTFRTYSGDRTGTGGYGKSHVFLMETGKAVKNGYRHEKRYPFLIWISLCPAVLPGFSQLRSSIAAVRITPTATPITARTFPAHLSHTS